MANGINETTKVTVPLGRFIIGLIFLFGFFGSIWGWYNSVANTTDKLRVDVDKKVDKEEFNKHVYRDSSDRANQYNDLKKDIQLIMQHFKIQQ